MEPDIPMEIIAVAVSVAMMTILTVFILLRHGRSRRRHSAWRSEQGEAYERFCAQLLVKEGFSNVELTPWSYDFGADILAQRDGISYAFQCKCYDKPVGVHAVQEVYAARDFYRCMVGVVITNQVCTQSARELADALNILLWEETEE